MADSQVIFLSGDLIFAGRVRAACESAGLKFGFAASLPEPGENGGAETGDDVRFVILDLSTRGGIMNDLVAQTRRHYPNARVIAYAPHVQKERLAAAREAGFDMVMTRAQFDGWVGNLTRT